MLIKTLLVLAFWAVCLANGGIISLPLKRVNDQYYVQLGLADKKTRLSIDVASAITQVECTTETSIFRKAYEFLRSPFYQQYNYKCPSRTTQTFKLGNLSIDVPFQQLRDQKEYAGRLGLQGDGDFLRNLPASHQVFSIFINSNEYGRPSRIDFGGFDSASAKTSMSFIPVSSRAPWTAGLTQVEVEELRLEGGPAVLSTVARRIGMPGTAWSALVSVMKRKHLCREKGSSFYCPCASGDMGYLPKINMLFGTKTVVLYPQSYISEEDDKCLLLFEPSKTQQWELGLPFFKDNVVVFENNHLLVGQAAQVNPISQTTKSPIQTVLNSAVIFLVCIFVSLVVIEVIRRVSGFAAAREQTIHEIMRRTQ